MKYRNYKKGFTLIELILVVGIFGLLASIVMFVLNPQEQVHKSRDARRKSDLLSISQALETYYQDNGAYPTSATNTYLIIDVDGTTSRTWGNPWQPYMNNLPKDPVSARKYAYYSTGQNYILYASLERGASDPQACNGGSACASMSTYSVNTSACGTTCNYGISSSDITP